MTAFEQSRQPGERAAQMAPSALADSASGEARICVRVWKTQDTAESRAISWQSNDPALYLVLDLISASKGVLSELRGPFLAATFAGVESAILTARRLQWAMQGFSGSDGTADIAVAILVQGSGDETDAGSSSQARITLEQAEPGQIFITPKTSDFLQNIPSLQLQAMPGSDVQELMWLNSAVAPNLSADEEAISALVKQNGLESEAPPSAKEEMRDPAAPTTEAVMPGVSAPAFSEKRPGPRDPGAIRGMSPRRLVGIGGGAVALLALVGFFTFWQKGQSHNPNPVSTPAAVVQSTPGSVTNSQSPGTGRPGQPTGLSDPGRTGPALAPAVSAAEIQKDRKHKGIGSAPKERTDQKEAAQKDKGGNCTLDSSDVPKMLVQADNNRGAGRYEDALRQYSRVLACDRESARARSGLELTRLAMQHQ